MLPRGKTGSAGSDLKLEPLLAIEQKRNDVMTDERRASQEALNVASDGAIVHAGMPFYSAVFNLTCTIIGSGTLTMPFIFAQCGWAVTNILALAIIFFTTFSVYLLITASDRIGVANARSFESLGYQTCGVGGSLYAQLTFIVGGIGTLTGYMIFIAKLLAQVTNVEGKLKYIPLLSIVIVTVLPLSMARRIHALRYVSIGALIAIGYIVGMYVTFEAWIGRYDDDPTGKYVYVPVTAMTFSLHSINSVNLSIGAFCVQNTCLPIYSELQNRSPRRMVLATLCAMLISCLIYEAIGLSGYLLFGGNVQGDSLLNMDEAFGEAHPWTRTPRDMAKVLMSVDLALITPLAIWPCRSAICSTLTQISVGHFGPAQDSASASNLLFRGTTVCILVIVVLLSIICPDVTVPLGIVNSVAGGSMIFVMPGMFYLGSRKHPSSTVQQSEALIGAYCMVALGIVVCIVGFYLQISSVIAKYG